MVKIGSKSGQSTASIGSLPAEESQSTGESTEHDGKVDWSTGSTEITDVSTIEQSTDSVAESTGSTTSKRQRQGSAGRSTGRSTRGKDHESVILDWSVLEPLFLDLKKHHVEIGIHMFRHKKFDRSGASYLIDIYRKLKKEGFE
jgi:hypothetical protein